jgi:predicted HTH domain antitoxin
METIQHIPKTSLARHTRQIIRSVQQGQTVIVEHHGQPEAAIMDILDYYLLQAVLQYHLHTPEIEPEAGLSDEAVAAITSPQERTNLAVAHYLAGSLSLSRLAELLGLSWLDLRTRFLRLDIPLRLAPADQEEALHDLANAATFS